MGRTEPLSRYEQLQVWRERRRAGLEKSLELQATTRNAMVGHINETARGAVQISEQMLRSRTGVDRRA